MMKIYFELLLVIIYVNSIEFQFKATREIIYERSRIEFNETIEENVLYVKLFFRDESYMENKYLIFKNIDPDMASQFVYFHRSEFPNEKEYDIAVSEGYDLIIPPYFIDGKDKLYFYIRTKNPDYIGKPIIYKFIIYDSDYINVDISDGKHMWYKNVFKIGKDIENIKFKIPKKNFSESEIKNKTKLLMVSVYSLSYLNETNLLYDNKKEKKNVKINIDEDDKKVFSFFMFDYSKNEDPNDSYFLLDVNVKETLTYVFVYIDEYTFENNEIRAYLEPDYFPILFYLSLEFGNKKLKFFINEEKYDNHTLIYDTYQRMELLINNPENNIITIRKNQTNSITLNWDYIPKFVFLREKDSNKGDRFGPLLSGFDYNISFNNEGIKWYSHLKVGTNIYSLNIAVIGLSQKLELYYIPCNSYPYCDKSLGELRQWNVSTKYNKTVGDKTYYSFILDSYSLSNESDIFGTSPNILYIYNPENRQYSIDIIYIQNDSKIITFISIVIIALCLALAIFIVIFILNYFKKKKQNVEVNDALMRSIDNISNVSEEK